MEPPYERHPAEDAFGCGAAVEASSRTGTATTDTWADRTDAQGAPLQTAGAPPSWTAPPPGRPAGTPRTGSSAAPPEDTAGWPTDTGWLGTQQTDALTPTGLVRLGARDYDPSLGVFTSPDPLTKFGDPASLDPYAYAGWNPIASSDPTGRLPYPSAACGWSTYTDCYPKNTGITRPANRPASPPTASGCKGSGCAGAKQPAVVQVWVSESLEENSSYVYDRMISRATDSAIAREGQLHSLFCATTSFMGPSLCTATRLAHRPDPFMYPEWAALVFPSGPWDIKTDYPDTASMSVRVGNVEVPVEGDKLGNIHYGYVGTAVGFNDFELTWLDKTDWIPTGDPEDMPAIRLGRQLWNEKGASLTKQEFQETVVRYQAERAGVFVDPAARLEIHPWP